MSPYLNRPGEGVLDLPGGLARVVRGFRRGSTPSATDLEDYVRSRSDRDYAVGTIARRVVALRGFLVHLVTKSVLQTSSAVTLDHR